MLRLHGFSASNYYNVAKLALLEKGLPFEEVEVYTGAGDTYRPDYLDMSPMGKVPCLQTDDGFISESRCIVEYLDAAHPEVPLLPGEPFARGKHQELYQVLELYLELPLRRLLPYALGGGKAPEALVNEVRPIVDKGALTLGQLASFEQFLTGSELRAVDIALAMHVPVIKLVSNGIYGKDVLAGVQGLAGYMARMEERPHVKKVRADSQANMGAFMAHLQKLYT